MAATKKTTKKKVVKKAAAPKKVDVSSSKKIAMAKYKKGEVTQTGQRVLYGILSMLFALGLFAAIVINPQKGIPLAVAAIIVVGILMYLTHQKNSKK